MASGLSRKWLKERSSGVLLHPTSLHSDQGIGVIGPEAREFVDFLEDAGFRYWQVLPLGPTGYGDSPYQSFSAFAGNPFLVDLNPLLEYGILKEEELSLLRELPHDHVHFGSIYRIKWPLLRLAHKRFHEKKRAYLPNYGLFEEFKRTHAGWLDPFCAFMALKDRFNGTFWGEWPVECRDPSIARKTQFWRETEKAREAHAFIQYLFFGQWEQLKKYANDAGIEIIGDTPIFVAMDSADVWASPEWFQMAKPGKPDFVAGVPPDYFSKSGQLWGNPLYDWKALESDNFAWWLDRMEANFTLFDVVRLDHFRGFYNYWRIPADAKDARSGKWIEGPQDALFKAIFENFPKAQLIAEDLGDIDDRVRVFREGLGLPGMAILQFAFDGNPDNLYLPHNLTRNSVLYPGTHDNNTTLGWYDGATTEIQDQVRRYLRVNGQDIAWDFIRTAYQSVSRLVILPMQDLLSQDADSRMNFPGSEQGNWQWRMPSRSFQEQTSSAPYLRELAWLYGR